MDFLMGLFVGLGIIVSNQSIKKNNKKLGRIGFVITIFTPIITYLFCLKKTEFAYGGTNLEFLIHSALIDKMIMPWIVLILFIAMLIVTCINYYRLIDKM